VPKLIARIFCWLLAGANLGMANDSTPVRSAGVDFIIKEALRTDTQLPLYVLCGGGLTKIASAAHRRPAHASLDWRARVPGPCHYRTARRSNTT
jgi:purine nucleosidase